MDHLTFLTTTDIFWYVLICAEIALNYADEVLQGGSKAVPNGMYL